MQLGSVVAPLDDRHTLTAGYTAADWQSVARETHISMYVPPEEQPLFEETSESLTSEARVSVPVASGEIAD